MGPKGEPKGKPKGRLPCASGTHSTARRGLRDVRAYVDVRRCQRGAVQERGGEWYSGGGAALELE